MKRQLFYTISAAALVSLSTSVVEAQPHRSRVAARHHHYHHHYAGGQGVNFQERYPTRPQYGYEEAPYDPSYYGPGAEVFRRTIQSAHEPGVTLELEPEAKETATGGPSGGLPSQSGGGGR